MFDARLRPVKERLSAPLVGALIAIPPLWLTAAGLGFGLASALAASDRRWGLALALFVLNRVFDGLDGDVARARSEGSDRGGYADIVIDTVVYAAIPLGAAAGSDIAHIWPITAVLIASFYINTMTWTHLAASLEKRGRRDQVESSTSVVMPVGLVEGTETAVFFVIMLAFPGWLDWTMAVMAAAVSIGAAARFVSGLSLLGRDAPTRPRVRL